jgi:NAD(P)-dependent dehydrogenase (short-subunit alcohol dehydrogenase family)
VATLPAEFSALDVTWIYASTKRALARWVRAHAAAADWAGKGIALNAVAPGVVRTPMTQPILDDPALAEMLTAATPMPYGGVAEPEAVARVIDFLAAAETTGITGQVLFIDGGADCVLRGPDIWSSSRL